MKSALELAMERLDGPLKSYTDAQKEELAEVDRKLNAKIAQAKIRTATQLQTTPRAEADELRGQLGIEIRGFNESRERQKDTLRKSFDEAE